jgi:hypothetical protein
MSKQIITERNMKFIKTERNAERCWFCDKAGGDHLIASPIYRRRKCYICFHCVGVAAMVVLAKEKEDA